MDLEKNRVVAWIIVAVLLVLFFLQGICAILNTGMTSDEYLHIAAGASYWASRDFRMNTEHPPLTKSLAGMPLAIMKAKSPIDSPAWKDKDQVAYADEFWKTNKERQRNLLTAARIPALLFSTLLGVFVFLMGWEIYNVKAGLLATALFAFEPNLIAHAALANSDVPIAMAVIATLYFAFKFLKTLKTAHFVGLLIFFGIAIATKYSGLLLFPVILLLYWYLLRNFPAQFHLPPHILGIKVPSKAGFIRGFVFVFAVAFWFAIAGALAIMASYCFKMTKINAENSPQYETLARETIPDFIPAKNSIIGISEKLPLPKEYLMGLYQVYMHNKVGHPAYLMGEFREKGWWYYFPAVFIYKVPLGILSLLLLSLVLMNRKDREVWIEESLLVIPILAYVIPAFFSHINIGFRHLFYIYPLILIYASGVMSLTFKVKKFDPDEFRIGGKQKAPQSGNIKLLALHSIVGALFLYVVASNLMSAPNHLSYANELSGDSQHKAYLMSDSNLDWGQGLPALKRFMDKQGIESVNLYYHMVDDPAVYGIECNREDPSKLDVASFAPGEVTAVSIWTPAGYGLTYDLFKDRAKVVEHQKRYNEFIKNKPDVVIGGCIWIFDEE